MHDQRRHRQRRSERAAPHPSTISRFDQPVPEDAWLPQAERAQREAATRAYLDLLRAEAQRRSPRNSR